MCPNASRRREVYMLVNSEALVYVRFQALVQEKQLCLILKLPEIADRKRRSF